AVHPDPVQYDHPLEAPRQVAVSPDGANVYSDDAGSDDLSRFMLSTSGALSFGGCLTSRDLTTGCSPITPDALRLVQSLAISPSGRDIYTAAPWGSDVAHFHRDPATGATQVGDCVTAAKDFGPSASLCTNLSDTSNALADVDSVAVSPDGRNVYATASGAFANGT